MIDTKVLCLGFVIAGLIGLNTKAMAQDMNMSDAGGSMITENMTETLKTETEMEKAAEKDMVAQRNMTSMDVNITG